MMKNTHVLKLLPLIALIVIRGEKLQCAEKTYAMLGNDHTIDCNIEDNADVYWYSEINSFKTPIVRLENGEKFIADSSDNNYGITYNGALVITNVMRHQFVAYKIYTIFYDTSTEMAVIQLIRAVVPNQQCPSISQCGESCSCISNSESLHNVTCSIAESRPKVKLSLIAGDIGNPSVTDLHIHYSYNNMSDTFNTTVFKQYSMAPCDVSIVVRCIVVESDIIENFESHVELISEPCVITNTQRTTNAVDTEENFSEHLSSTLIIIIAIAAAATLVGVTCVIVFIVCRKRTGDASNKQPIDQDVELAESKPILESHESQSDSCLGKKAEKYENERVSMEPPNKNNDEEQKGVLDRLIRHLEDVYRKLSYTKPTPWESEMLIDKVYIDRQCKVKQADETNSSQEKLSTVMQRKEDLKRVLLIAEIGYGKSTFQQYQACQWLNNSYEEKKEELLFILLLKDLHIYSDIVAALCKSLPKTLKIERGDMASVLMNRKCNLLLDGLDELDMKTSDSRQDDEKVDDVTIHDLLTNPSHSRLPNMRLCVTSRDIEITNASFSPPYTQIQLLPFANDDLEAYIKKACDRYEDDTSKIEDTEKMVQKVLADNNLLRDFQHYPLFTVLFIQIILSKLTKYGHEEKLVNVNLEKISSLIPVVIFCLKERYLSKKKEENVPVKEILQKLGSASLAKDGNLVQYLPEDIVKNELAKKFDPSISMGLIRKVTRKHVVSAVNVANILSVAPSYITFFHGYIQEYCVAFYVATSGGNEINSLVKTIINTSERNARYARILQFICVINGQLRFRILTNLRTSGLWNSYIDCIFELSDKSYTENLKAIQETKPKIKVDVLRLDEPYHQKAFKEFCKRSRNNNITITSMSFGKDCDLPFLVDVTLPKVDMLIIADNDLNQGESFSKTITSFRESVKTIRFQDCKLPNRIDVKTLLDKQYSVKIEKASSMNSDLYSFDRAKGKWNKVIFAAFR